MYTYVTRSNSKHWPHPGLHHASAMARVPQHHSSAGRARHHCAAAARSASLPPATLQDGATEKGGLAIAAMERGWDGVGGCAQLNTYIYICICRQLIWYIGDLDDIE